MHALSTPLNETTVRSLIQGDTIQLTGTLFTGRDAAHKRFMELLAARKPLPVDLEGQLLYYTGPSPARPGEVIGSAGPTTASRMDKYTPQLIAATGLRGIIGKGNRGNTVVDALVKHSCVYFAATGGAGALLGRCIKKARVVCYEDLGAEAVFELEVVDFPLTVAIDTLGGNRFIKGPEEWRGRAGE